MNYEVIDYVTRGMTGLGCSSNQVATYEVDEPAAYTYYKLVINTCWWGGDAVSFAELDLYNYVEPTPDTNEPTTNTPDTTEPETNVPKTGDAVVYSVVAAVAVLALGAVVVSKKRRITE